MAPDSPQYLVQTMNEVARSLASQPDLSQVLELIAKTATENIPGADHASISVIDKSGRMETLVPTDRFVADADRLQASLGEGPCLDAAAGRHNIVRTDDISLETRWPKYSPQAADYGVGAQMAMHLYQSNQSFGGLNLYFDRPGSITDETVDIAELIATYASNALGYARQVEGFNQALATRKSIGQAIGIVMERYKIDEDRAFEFLVRVSQTGNVKLRAVADEIVGSANQGTRSA